MHRSPTLDEVGGAALYLLSDLSGAVTGEIHFVDCGYNTIAMPNIETLKAHDKGEKAEKEPEAEREKPPREAAQ
jgi:enoyl-[acyl-carrier protein] reductase I